MSFEDLRPLLDGMVDGKKLSGSSCVVYYKNEKVFEHSTGYSDWENKVPMKGDEQYFIYSMSKPVTCTAAMQLYEKGKFLLCDPLYEYIPEFKDMMVKTENGIEKCDVPITIEDLFTMSSGLNYDLCTDAIKQAQKDTNGKLTSVDLARALATQPLDFVPKTRWQYSLGHDVIAALVEVITGERFGEYMRKNIFEPVGMKRTGFDESKFDMNSFAKQYIYNAETDSLEPRALRTAYKLGSEHDCGGAGLISCVEDYGLFVKTMANNGVCDNGERIISRNTMDLMRTNFLDQNRLKDFGDFYSKFGYGYGLGVRTLIDRVKGGANGSLGEFGWDGAAGSYGLMDPDAGVAIAYTQHVLGAIPTEMHRRMKSIVYSSI